MGDGFSVSGNTIGYASSTGTGTYTMPWAVTTNSFYKFQAIYVSVGTNTVTNITGNTIANISIQSQVSAAQGNIATGGILTGIYVAAGTLNIANNTIGATSGTGSLTATVGGLGTGTTINNIGGVVGVFIGGSSASNITLDGNTIASLRTVDSNLVKPTACFGLFLNVSVNNLTIKNNTFGNTTANSFMAGTTASGSTLNSLVAGIYGNSASAVSSFDCYGNTFQNFTAVGSGTAGYARGIQLPTNGSPAYNIYNNTINNISANNLYTANASGLTSVMGLNLSTSGAASANIYGNTITNLSNTNTTASATSVIVAGISIATATITPRIFNNKIYGLSNAGTGTTAIQQPIAAGIIIYAAGTSDSVYNNMISLGTGQTTNTSFVGIWAPFTLSPQPTTSYFYHNTVNITGTASSGAWPSFCFLRGAFSATPSTVNVTVKNNIFTNSRSGGTGVHYAIGNCNPATTATTTGWVSNYNVLNAPVSVGWHNAALTFANWKTGTGGDANSSNGSTVNYVDGATDLHMASSMGSTTNSVESAGDPALGINKDIDGETRPGTTNANGGGIIPDLGADEFDGKYTSTCSLSGYTPTTNASTSTISCYGGTTNLSLSSLPTGTGITYQWQSSTDGIAYNNIAGATGTTYTATPTDASTYYYCAVTCYNGTPTTVNSSATNITAPTKMSGTYTINNIAAASSTNYQTFQAAFTDLACKGVSGAVTFNVSNGPYIEQATLNAIPFVSATNNVTINGGGRTLKAYITSATNRALLALNGAKYVTIDNLVIDTLNSTGATGGTPSSSTYGILLMGGADYNTISNCNINVGTSNTTATNVVGIVLSGSAAAFNVSGNNGSYNNIIGNTIKGGYYGITLYGNSTGTTLYGTGNNISGNNVDNFYAKGIYVQYQKNLIIENSDVARTSRVTATGTVTGIDVTSCGDNITVRKNKVHDLFAATPTTTLTSYGINMSATSTLGNASKCYNNMVWNISSNAEQRGINIQGAYEEFYYNTVILDKATTGAYNSYGFYHSSSGAGFVFKNNLAYISRDSTTGLMRGMYIGSAPISMVCDYNNYYVVSPKSGYTGGNYALALYLSSGGTTAATMPLWTAGTGFDANGLSVNPLFFSPSSGDVAGYTPTSGSMDAFGTPISGITTDLLGNGRNATDPDMGAIEYSSGTCTDPPTPGTATTSAATVCSGSSFTLDITGQSVGTVQRYRWQSSATGTSGWSYISASAKATSLTVSQTTTTYYRAEVICNSGTPAYTPAVLVTTPAQLNGLTYTINKAAAASSTNFTSFASAVATLNCGIGGPVKFTVYNGPYNESITLTPITGASATNTVTFDGNGQTLVFTSNNSAARNAILLNGADYITINNLTIDATGGTYGNGVVFTNAADYNTISNCTINTNTNGTASNWAGILFTANINASGGTGGNNGNYNTISGNTINGGYYGIVLYGNSGAPVVGNQAINNTIKDIYTNHIYVVYNDNAIVRGNNIYNTVRTNFSSPIGISLAAGCTRVTIDRNKIHNIFDAAGASAYTGSFYGIQDNNGTGAADFSTTNPVTNNLIYGINHVGIIAGIYLSSAVYKNVYHNTVILDNTSASTTANTDGIWLASTPSNCNLKNNLVYITRGGTGTKRCIYANTGATGLSINNNLLYMGATTGTLNYVGQNGATIYTTFTDWQTAGFDVNGLSTKPVFVNASAANYAMFGTAFNDKGTNVGVTNDINGATRSTTTPDIGAFEFDVANCTDPVAPGTVVASTTNACYGDNFTLDLTNNSVGLLQTYQWQKSPNGTSGWTNVGSALSAPTFVTSQTDDNYYRCEVKCNGGTAGYSNVVFITTPALVSGTFTIDQTNSTVPGVTFATFAEAVSYISCGINGPVTFNVVSGTGPYTEQFTIPQINGASAANPITFNGNGETLQFNSQNTNNRNGITLNGADWVTITGFYIDGSYGAAQTSGTWYATGICLYNQADNNTIINNTVDVGRNGTNQSNFMGIIVNGTVGSLSTGNGGNNNTISNNTVYGGGYSIVLYGLNTNLSSNNTISNNNIVDWFNFGIYTFYGTGTIRNNDIYRTTVRLNTNYGSAATYGIDLFGSTNIIVEKNKIHDFFASGATNSAAVTAEGIYASTGSGASGYIIRNNLVYNMNCDGALYGIFCGASPAQIYHNTVVLDYAGTSATTGTTVGINLAASGGANDVRNNIIHVTRGSSGINRAVYITVASTSHTISNNDIYFVPSTATGATNYFASYVSSANYSDVASFQSGYSGLGGVSANNVNVNPNYANAAGGNYAAISSSLNGVGATTLGVTTDILGNNRTVFFTPGAYEVDNQAPVIANATIPSACSPSLGATSITLNGVTISDGTGVQTTGVNMPRIYFKKGSGGTWYSAAGTIASGNALSGTWNFTIDHAAVGGVTTGDVIYYFVAAQDVYVTPNFGASATGVVATSVSSITTYPTGNSVTIQSVTPSVSISTAATTICSADVVTFTATGTNPGSTPVYTWKKNGSSVGAGASITFPSNTFTNGDVVTCELTANNPCQTTATATSNSITLTVNLSPTMQANKNYKTQLVTSSALFCKLGDTLQLVNYSSPFYGSWASSNSSVATATTVSSTQNKLAYVIITGVGTTNVTYSLTSSTNGCQAGATTIVTVAPNNAVVEPITGGSSGICINSSSSVQLACTTPNGVWSVVPNNRLAVSASGAVTSQNIGAGTADISYSVYNAQGCPAKSTYTFTVWSLPMVPSVSYTAGYTNPQTTGGYCTNKTFGVTGTSAVSSLWTKTGAISISSPATNNSIVVSTSATIGAATLKYEITDAHGCKNSRTISGNVVTCAAKGISSNEAQGITNSNFVLYPNPARNIVNIKMDRLVGEGNIAVTDIYGKQVRLQPLSMGNNTIDISNLAKGFYTVSIITSEGKSTQKLIVE